MHQIIPTSKDRNYDIIVISSPIWIDLNRRRPRSCMGKRLVIDALWGGAYQVNRVVPVYRQFTVVIIDWQSKRSFPVAMGIAADEHIRKKYIQPAIRTYCGAQKRMPP